VIHDEFFHRKIVLQRIEERELNQEVSGLEKQDAQKHQISEMIVAVNCTCLPNNKKTTQ
jgi:hypothetical protein